MAISDKLTYLNTTKSLIRDGINAIGGELTSNDTFRSYVNALNNIYDYLPKVTGTGTSITLNDTAKGKMILELDPSELTQDGTPTPSSPQDIHTISGSNKVIVCGKNLFDGEWEVGYININTGVDVASANVRTKNFIRIQPNTQYAISNTTSHDTWAVYYTQNKAYISNQKIKTGLSETFTTPNDSNIYYIRWYDAGSTGDTPKWQLEKGSTATTYEPYVSQEADIDLGDIEYCKIGNYEYKFIRNSGKNLFDKNNVSVFNAYISSSGVISANSPDRTIWLKIEKNTNYTFQMTQKALSNSSSVDDVRITLFSSQPAIGSTGTNVYSQSRTSSTQDYYYQYTFNSGDNEYVAIKILNTAKSDYDTTIATIQLEKGLTATSYEPYGSNEWYIKKNIGKVVLDGTENWEAQWLISGGSDTNGFRTTISDILVSTSTSETPNLFSNYFSPQTQSYTSTHGGCICRRTNQTQIIATNNDTATVSDFKTWLSTHNTDVYYPLETPTYTQITGTLAEQLENVYQKMLSQTGTTNISQVNNDLPFVLNVSALQDLSTL